MRLVLHIGFHKTGSSALQAFLSHNRDRLADAGALYPEPLVKGVAHADLSHALGFLNPSGHDMMGVTDDEALAHYREILARADQPTVILSCEQFCLGNYAADAMTRLKAFTDDLGAEVEVVAYVRDPLDFVLSIYHHEIRSTASTKTFPEFLVQFDPTNWRFERRLKTWRDTYGEDRLTVLDYTQTVRDKIDVAGRFLEEIGVEIEGEPVRTDAVNRNLHPALVEAYIALKGKALPAPKKKQLREGLMRAGHKLPKVDPAAYYLGVGPAQALRRRMKIDAAR